MHVKQYLTSVICGAECHIGDSVPAPSVHDRCFAPHVNQTAVLRANQSHPIPAIFQMISSGQRFRAFVAVAAWLLVTVPPPFSFSDHIGT